MISQEHEKSRRIFWDSLEKKKLRSFFNRLSLDAQTYTRDKEAKDDGNGTYEDDEDPLLDPPHMKPKGVPNYKFKVILRSARKVQPKAKQVSNNLF